MSPNLADAPVVRPTRPSDQDAILAIYREGIATGDATFASGSPDWQEWDAGHLEICRFVAEQKGLVLGWAALSSTSGRCVYGGVAEVSVYVRHDAAGRGVGTRLMDTLIKASESAGLWTLEAGIFVDNEPSIALHQKCGFRTVGIREKLGKMTHGDKAGLWRDVVLMERRSVTVGQS